MGHFIIRRDCLLGVGGTGGGGGGVGSAKSRMGSWMGSGVRSAWSIPVLPPF